MRARRVGTTVIAAIGLSALTIGVLPTSGNAVSARHDRVVSSNPANMTPNILDGRVLAVAVVRGMVVVGGTFTRVRNAGSTRDITRRHLFAFDARTGRIDPRFRPRVNGVVETIARTRGGRNVIIGGSFRRVDGAKQRGLAKLRLRDGSRRAGFRARTGGTVEKAVVRGHRLVVGGNFTSANGKPRRKLAVFDPGNGKLKRTFNFKIRKSRNRHVGTSVRELDVSRDGSRLVIVGNFRQVNGHKRKQIALINLDRKKVTRWSTSRFEGGRAKVFHTYLRDVEFAPDGSYFVTVTTGRCRNRVLHDAAIRWESRPQRPRRQPTWTNFTGGDSLYSVAVTGAAVYVGGHQRWMSNPRGCDYAGSGAVPRRGIAALSPRTGKPLRWNPGRARGVGVQDLVGSKRGLYVGSDTTELGGEYHARIGFFPLGTP